MAKYRYDTRRMTPPARLALVSHLVRSVHLTEPEIHGSIAFLALLDALASPSCGRQVPPHAGLGA